MYSLLLLFLLPLLHTYYCSPGRLTEPGKKIFHPIGLTSLGGEKEFYRLL